jgi:predicted enzyme related to lactoylglutathione lyase
MAHGTAATQDFYQELFGWEFRPGSGRLGPYVRALLAGREVAGIGHMPPDQELPVAWTPYFACEDADATAESVRHCGGTVGVGPLDAGADGRIAVAVDPTGAVFGIWQPPVHGDAAADAESTAGPVDRVVLRRRGRPVAAVRGMGQALPRDRGAHWVTYFRVADVDAAAARVAALGGRVLEPPHEGPHGRTATVTDPEGALFALLREPR